MIQDPKFPTKIQEPQLNNTGEYHQQMDRRLVSLLTFLIPSFMLKNKGHPVPSLLLFFQSLQNVQALH